MTTPESIAAVTSNVLWVESADGLALVDQNGIIRGTNEALDALFMVKSSDLVGQPIEQLIPIEARDRHIVLRTEFEDNPVGRPMLDGLHFRGLRSDRSTFPVTVGLTRLVTTEGQMSIAAVRDLSQREHAESELAVARRRTALIEEQQRIASDLHDTVVQRLFALGLHLNMTVGRVVDEKIRETLATTVETIDEIIVDIRDSIYGLQTSPAEGTLSQRVFDVLGEMEAGFEFELDVDIDSKVDQVNNPVLVEHFLKVLRESVSNVARHAQATLTRIEISHLDSHLVLVVHDDGRGMSNPVDGYGLATMKRRADGLGGSLDIDSSPSTGTRLRWIAPTTTAAFPE